MAEKWLKNPKSVLSAELANAGYIAGAHVCYVTAIVNAVNFTYCPNYAAYAVSWALADWGPGSGRKCRSKIKDSLINYLIYLLPKELEFNNFNIDLLKQNQQAYKFLEKITKLEDWQVTDDDLFGIRQIFDVLEEVGAPLDPNEFQWEKLDVIEKHKLLQTIRREF